MQFQVPQFIEKEDKIVGPFSLRQFIYVAITFIICFTLFVMVETWLFVIVSIFVVAIGLSFAFVKINGRSITAMVLSAISFYWKPQTYVWRSENSPSSAEQGSDAPSSLQDIVSGFLLKNTLQNLKTRTPGGKGFVKRQQTTQERYEIFQRTSGEREAARRIDYR